MKRLTSLGALALLITACGASPTTATNAALSNNLICYPLVASPGTFTHEGPSTLFKCLGDKDHNCSILPFTQIITKKDLVKNKVYIEIADSDGWSNYEKLGCYSLDPNMSSNSLSLDVSTCIQKIPEHETYTIEMGCNAIKINDVWFTFAATAGGN